MTQPSFVKFELDRRDGKRACFTSSTDIVDYFEPARTFGESDLAPESAISEFQQRLLAVPDHRPETISPMVFTIGSAGELHLVRRTEEATAGWERIDLLGNIAAGGEARLKVLAFDVDWDESGDMTVIVAARPASDRGQCEIYAASNLNSETSDFSAIEWERWGGRNVEVKGLKVARKPAGRWIAIAAGQEGPAGKTFILDSRQPDKSFAKAIQFNTGVSLSKVLSFDLGALARGDQAIHSLGTDARGTVGLQTRAVPQFDAQGRLQSTPPVQTWHCPPEARVLAVGMPTSRGSDLYIGGEGIHRIAAKEFVYGAQARREQVIDPDVVKGIKRLVVAQSAEGGITVWAVDRSRRLWTVRRDAESATWSLPLCLREGVTEVAPVRADDHHTTSVLVVYQGGEATHLWRDGQEEGVWQEAPIRVNDPGTGSKVTCFGTNFRVLTKNRTPRPGVPVTLTASVLSSLVVNGKSILVGPDLPAEIETKEDGSIGIFNRADTFTPATYRLQFNDLDKAIEIIPSAGIFERFRTLTARDLREAKVNGNEALLPDTMRSEQAKGDVEAFARALNHAAMLAPAGNSGVKGISFVDPRAPFGGEIDASKLPDTFTLSVSGTAGGAVAKSPARTSSGRLEGIGETLSDILESVLGAIENGASYLVDKVKDGIRFVCTVAGKVKEFIVSTIEEIGAFFSNLWDTVVEVADKVWDYLKFLFDWEDVLVMRDIITNAIEQRLKAARKDINVGKKKISASIDSLRDSIASFAHTLGIENYKKLPPPSALQSRRTLADGAATDTKMEAAQNNSVTSWLSDNLSSIFSEIIKVEVPDVQDEDDVPELGLETIGDTFKAAWDALKDDLQGIVGPDFDIGDLTVDTIMRVLAVIGLRIAETALGTFEVLLIKLLEIAERVLGLLQMIMFSRVSFPFIEKLIELVSGEKVDTSFRPIDVLSLIVAIPATLIFKLATNERPPRELQTWQGGDVVFVQSTGPSAAKLTSTQRQIMTIASPIFGLGFLAYSAYKTSKNLVAGPDGMDPKKYGITASTMDAVGAFYTFCTNVMGEISLGWSSETGAEAFVHVLLFYVGLGQVAWQWSARSTNKLQQKTALLEDRHLISSQENYGNMMKKADMNLAFGIVSGLLKAVQFTLSSRTGVAAWAQFTGASTKYLGQIIFSIGTQSKNPKIIAAGVAVNVLAIPAAIVQVVAERSDASDAPA